MALKEYAWNGYTWQFEETEAPEGAIPLGARAPKAARAASNKARRAPANKVRSPRGKAADD